MTIKTNILEIHYEVVLQIESRLNAGHEKICKFYEIDGRPIMYQLAKEMTHKFVSERGSDPIDTQKEVEEFSKCELDE